MSNLQVAITGAGGLIGQALVSRLADEGYRVLRLVRRAPSGEDEAQWHPRDGLTEPKALAGTEVVFHLAGESLSSLRWTAAKKRAIRESRVEGTRALCSSLARMAQPPTTLVVASAVGYYGNRGDALLTEGDSAGEGFLAQVCRDWEAAADPAREAGIRVVNARLGIVLSPRGGALAAMLPAFRMGLGAQLGSGDQWMSWITLHDAIGALLLCAREETLAGPVNVVSPNPVTHRQFNKTLASVLRRPSFLRVPAGVMKLAGGDMAREMLLASGRALPEVLQEHGYAFRQPELEGALRELALG